MKPRGWVSMLAMIRALQLPDTNLNILRPQWVLKRVGKREGPRLCEYEAKQLQSLYLLQLGNAHIFTTRGRGCELRGGSVVSCVKRISFNRNPLGALPPQKNRHASYVTGKGNDLIARSLSRWHKTSPNPSGFNANWEEI